MKTLLDINTKEATLREAIDYGRFSDKDQGAGDSKRRQTEGAKRFAQTHGLTIVRSVFDDGLSAFHGDHIKYGKLGGLLQEIKDGKIKPGTVLLVECIDRLSREAPIAQFTLLVQILSAGIEVVTFADNQWYTFASINEHPHELFGVLGIMTRANDESKTKAGRTKENWAQKRQRMPEEKLTARCPSWLKLNPDRTRWDLIPARVKLVRRIFAMALAGMGTHMIATQFNREGNKPWRSGAIWEAGTIRYILSSRAVLGEFQPCVQIDKRHRKPEGRPDPNYFPRIIEPAVFERVNCVIRRNSGVSGKVRYLFDGLLFDGVTGTPLRHMGVPDETKANRHAYLYCCSQKPSQGWDYGIFENSFLHHLNNIDWADLVVSPMRAVNASEKNRLEAEQARIERTLARMTNILKDEENPPKTLVNEMKTLELELCQLEQKLARLDSNGDNLVRRQRFMKDAKMEFDKLLRTKTRTARLRLRFEIRTLVKRIDLWADPMKCTEMQNIAVLIAKAVAQSDWKLKSETATWPCYRITFANGVVRWVLCERIRLGRREPRHSLDAARNTIVITPWESYAMENAL
ncbi:MAG: recombinase family protein [Limisphaerales bacterium]